jgi:hypothetical protein
MKEPRAHPMAALFRSASSRTIQEAFPPSSSSRGFIYLPAMDAIIDPVRVLPVKVTFFTTGWAIKAVVTFSASDN